VETVRKAGGRIDVSDAAVHRAFLAEQMADPETNWSLGTFGAIAEFARDPDEPVALSDGDGSIVAVTGRGGIRITPRDDVRLFASETTTRESWNHRIALCLEHDRCAMNGRATLTELGPDRAGLREQDRDAVLFDLGLGALHVDLCIRVGDPRVVAELRALAGRALFDPGNPVMGVILTANPHRVFISRLGRIEVFQPIPPVDGKSPEGPHTHVLPRLLQHRRTHSATELVPDGWIPCAHLYPAHPAKDSAGRRLPFDRARHDAFQDMLRSFGDPDIYALKQQVVAAVAAGQDPSVIAVTDNRFARTNVRVALRQLKAADAVSSALVQWLAAHERADQVGGEDNVTGHD
jgi:hypothetical protein